MLDKQWVGLLLQVQTKPLEELAQEYYSLFPVGDRSKEEIMADFIKWLALMRGMSITYTPEEALAHFGDNPEWAKPLR